MAKNGIGYYAGIGSRETPEEFCTLFSNIAKYLSGRGFVLRSGGAQGADSAFERGCIGDKEIYLPWSGFEGNKSNLIVKDKLAFELAEKFHPYWDNMSQGAQRLHARNIHQVLGKDLDTPADFVVCWTKDGKGSGGTGQAIRIAKAYKVPIFDLGICKTSKEAGLYFWDKLCEIDLKNSGGEYGM